MINKQFLNLVYDMAKIVIEAWIFIEFLLSRKFEFEF